MFFSRLRLGDANNGHLWTCAQDPGDWRSQTVMAEEVRGEAFSLSKRRLARTRATGGIADNVDFAVACAALCVAENPGICIGDPSIFQAQTFNERQRVGCERDLLTFERRRTPFKIDAQAT